MASAADLHHATSRTLAEARVRAIYENRDVPLPSNFNALVNNVMSQGAGYFDTIRAHAARDAQAQVGGGVTPLPQIRNDDPEVDPGLAARQANASSMRDVMRWLPKELLDLYVSEWVKHGDPQLAWGTVRTNPAHARHFPGLTREDGSLRMSEQDYLAHREAFRRELTQFGLNPQVFEGLHPRLIEGDVSVSEMRQRLQAKVQGVVQNLPAVRERFGQFFGVDALDDTALIGAALDPQIGLDLLQGRITAAQISGEAQTFGFDRGREASERLAFAGGIDQAGARQLFSQAATAVPRFARFAGRFQEQRGFGIEEFEQASVFADPEERRRMQRLTASEQALFSPGGSLRRDDQGLRGLRRR